MAKRRASNSSEIRIGPWPLGIDNVHAPEHAVFQVGRETPPRLRAAADVDLDDEGWLRSRSPADLVTEITAPLGLWRLGGATLTQDGPVLSASTGATVADLSARASLCEHAARIFGTDGAIHFEIEGATVRTWGLPVPALTLSATTGALPAGRYLVQASFVDARGNEGGASAVVALTLAETGGIAIDLDEPASADVVLVRLYGGRADQKATSFLAEVSPAALPYAFGAKPGTAALPPVTEQMRGPFELAAGLFSFRAFLLMWRDNVVFHSEAHEPHLFYPDSFMPFPSTVRACAGLEGGMWIGTDDGLWWVAGEHPEAWIPARRSTTGVVPDCAVVDAGKLPALQSIGPAALFVQADGGLVAGTGAGTLVDLTDGRYRLSPATRASIAYVERGDLAQVLIAVT